MEDYKKRGLLLKSFYDKRKEGMIRCTKDILEIDLPNSEIERLAEQLSEHNLINWEPTPDESGIIIVSEGKITAKGVDVVEQGGTNLPLKIVIDKSINVTDSSNIQIGNSNIIYELSLKDLFASIEKAELNEKDKKDLKQRLNNIIKHPAVLLVLQNLGKIIGL